MEKNWMMVGKVVILLVLSVSAYFLAAGMNSSIEQYRSPLHDAPPTPSNFQNDAISRRLVIVLIDALRLDTSLNQNVMPTLAGLRRVGASATMHSQTPSYSIPGYGTLFSGAWPYLNDGPAFNLDYEVIPTWSQDNLFVSANRAGLKTAVSGYYWFEKLIPQTTIAESFYTPGEDANADRQVVDAALPWLDDPSLQLVLIHIDQVDYAGHHEGGSLNENWNAAAARADSLVNEILAKLDLTQDTILVLSDHGQIDRGGHGGADPVTMLEPFVLAGSGILPGEYGDIQMVDVTPTSAVLLGAYIPAISQGTPLVEMLTFSSSQKLAIETESKNLQQKLTSAYAQAIGMDLQPGVTTSIENLMLFRQARDRIRGVIWFLPVLGLLLWLMYTLGKEAGWKSWAALISYPVIYLLVHRFVGQRPLSFSSIDSSTGLVLFNAWVTLISLLVSLGLYFVIGQISKQTQSNTPKQVISLGLMIDCLMIMVMVFSYWFNSQWAFWNLPQMDVYYLALAAAVNMLLVGVYCALIAGGSKLFGKLITRKLSSAKTA